MWKVKSPQNSGSNLSPTTLLKNKISMKIIQERLGHSIMQTTSDIYTHVTKEMNTEATDVLSKVLYAKKAREN
ncbi:hypothetical protein ACN077_24595 [Clostridium chromiireducens]|uniref:hypothetical protein n=1 Tax=Clostridium chromiireducens TaxID=225345 RepID=UPI003AF64B31